MLSSNVPGFFVVARLLVLSAMSLLTFGCSVFGIESVEEAPYQSVLIENNFELRDYEPLVFVETQVDGNFKDAGRQSFRRLFAYISGDNERE